MNRRRFNTQCISLLTASRFASAGETRAHIITDYGAKEGGTAKCTEAIRAAILRCGQTGGGQVVVPAGRFLTGAIHLEDNVHLHLSAGSTLVFSQDPADYLPAVFTRFEGVECINYSPFIYAFGKTNIGVTGPGILDGQASDTAWWPWAAKAQHGAKPNLPNATVDRKSLFDMGERNVPVDQRVFGAGHYLRPNFVQPYRCKNILLADFTITNSPMWELNPVLCSNVTVRHIHIQSHGPNNDGCDPECCDGVFIDSCTFDTGDDCIAIKSGRNADGRRVNVPCQNISIRNCSMKDGHGGVSIGSEVSGGIRNVEVVNCQMSSPHLQRALRIKTNSYRGGLIENIVFHNVQIDQVEEAVIEVDYFYEEGAGGRFNPIVNAVDVAHVTCKKSKHAIFLRGFPDDPIGGVKISDCSFGSASEGTFFQDVSNVQLENVEVNGRPFTNADINVHRVPF